MKPKNWNELSGKQKGTLIALALAQFALLIAALRDIKSRDASEIKGSKRLWTAVSFIDFIGPLAYFRFGRK